MTSLGIKVTITACVDDYQPGVVACEFDDADGKTHRFIEKAPVVSERQLDRLSPYPLEGIIACEVQQRFAGGDGNRLVEIDTEKPWGIESTEGLTVFVVHTEQLVDCY
jgi:hypothetical protein